MSLKLFRATGNQSILGVGETRTATHPGWLVFTIALWIGFACNVALWRELVPGSEAGRGLPWSLVAGSLAASASGIVLSLLGWRRTFKAAATLLLLMAALAAAGAWSQSLPLDARLFETNVSALLPAWRELLRWEVPVLLCVLALLPIAMLWNTKIRRLPGPEQLSVNIGGLAIGGVVLAISGFALLRGLV